MSQRLISFEFTISSIRWIARVMGVCLVGLVVLFLIGEGGFNPLRATWHESLQMLSVLLTCIGLLSAWRRELFGGALAVGGMLMFYALDFAAHGHFPRGWVFGVIALNGLLFILAWLISTSPRSETG
jgi:hypothetical protein